MQQRFTITDYERFQRTIEVETEIIDTKESIDTTIDRKEFEQWLEDYEHLQEEDPRWPGMIRNFPVEDYWLFIPRKIVLLDLADFIEYKKDKSVFDAVEHSIAEICEDYKN